MEDWLFQSLLFSVQKFSLIFSIIKLIIPSYRFNTFLRRLSTTALLAKTIQWWSKLRSRWATAIKRAWSAAFLIDFYCWFLILLLLVNWWDLWGEIWEWIKLNDFITLASSRSWQFFVVLLTKRAVLLLRKYLFLFGSIGFRRYDGLRFWMPISCRFNWFNLNYTLLWSLSGPWFLRRLGFLRLWEHWRVLRFLFFT